MEVEIRSIKEEKVFIPAVVEITIETEAEFLELFHRSNIQLESVRNGYASGAKPRLLETSGVVSKLFCALHRFANQRGIVRY